MLEIVKELRRVAATAQMPTSSAEMSPARLSQTIPQQALPPAQQQPPQQQHARQASPASAQQQALKSLPRTQMPVIPAIFPELEELSCVLLRSLEAAGGDE